jgi:concanavalin A-like lectin/glucanase superfamily protein
MKRLMRSLLLLFWGSLFASATLAQNNTCTPPPLEMISWWPGDGNARDIVDGNNGTLVGNTSFSPAEVGQGFSFNMDGDGVTIAHNSNLNPQCPGFSADFWMKGVKNQPQSDATLFEKSHGFVDATGWAFQVGSSSGQPRFAMGNGSGFPEITAAIDVLDNRFHLIAGTWDCTTMRMYVDGVFMGAIGNSSASSSSAINTRNVNIGFAWGGGFSQRFFRGIIDEVEVQGLALSQSEIQAIYSAGSAGKCKLKCSGAPEGSTCGDACAPGTCQSGVCVQTFAAAGTTCVDDGNPCTVDQCDGSGICAHVPGNAGTVCRPSAGPCDVAETCTGTSALCPADQFQPSSTVCRPSAGPCDVAETCTGTSPSCPADQKAPDGSPCDDHNPCTQTDVCQNGTCIGSNPIVCSASDQCHVAGTCDPATGTCSNPAAANGTACNDGNACTRTDTCQSGACVGSNPVTCTASDQCHVAGTCDPATGACSNPAAADGTACNDGNACTRTDTCQSGACVGSNPVTCTASDQCHVAGTCDPMTGICSNPVAPDGTTCSSGDVCSGGDFCHSGVCQPGPCSACSGMVTGGGQVHTASGGLASFSFNSRSRGDGTATGSFQWTNHDARCRIDGDVTKLITCPADRSATLEGSCGPSCTFVVKVHDAGEPGNRDTIDVTSTGTCPGTAGNQMIVNGNIQFH